MTDLQYALLCKVKQHEPCPDECFTKEEQLLIPSCLHEHWVTWTRESMRLILLDKGRAAMLEYEHQHDQLQRQQNEADEKQSVQKRENEAKQFRRDLGIACLSSVVGGIVTLLIEHLGDVADFCEKVFLRIVS